MDIGNISKNTNNDNLVNNLVKSFNKSRREYTSDDSNEKKILYNCRNCYTSMPIKNHIDINDGHNEYITCASTVFCDQCFDIYKKILKIPIEKITKESKLIMKTKKAYSTVIELLNTEFGEYNLHFSWTYETKRDNNGNLVFGQGLYNIYVYRSGYSDLDEKYPTYKSKKII